MVFSSNGFTLISDFSYDGHSTNDMSVQAILNNVTFINSDGADFVYIGVLLVNCTFKNNTGSAIRALASKVIFQGNHVFENNSAFIGGGIQLN